MVILVLVNISTVFEKHLLSKCIANYKGNKNVCVRIVKEVEQQIKHLLSIRLVPSGALYVVSPALYEYLRTEPTGSFQH